MKRLLTDMLGRTVFLSESPKRIISLCPSQTEALVELVGTERLVGRTRFCIHPGEELARVERVGGTKQVKMERVHALNPDLIICEKEENTPEMVAELEAHYPVVVTDVTDFASALAMMELLGEAVNEKEKARNWVNRIQYAWQGVGDSSTKIRVAYLIWKDPWMVVGKDTYIGAVLDRMGWENVGKKLEGRYPVSEVAQIQALQPTHILLSSEPYPFGPSHLAEWETHIPGAKVWLVDGEMFSWYGTRMLEAAEYLKRLAIDMESNP